MKIIFLDIDGVLNSEMYAVKIHTQQVSGADLFSWQFVDPECLHRILKICEETGAKLIISSSWRIGKLKDTLADFDKYESLSQLNPYIIGVTARSASRIRGEEIDHLLTYWKEYAEFGYINIKYKYEEVEDYVILDDDKDILSYQFDHFVNTDWFEGLTDGQTIKIIKRFNNE